jgi:hypothetical protein
VIRPASANTNLTFSPSTVTLGTDAPSNVNININGGADLSGAELTFQFDPEAFSIVDAHAGAFLGDGNVAVSVVQAIDTQKGTARITLDRPTGTAPAPNGVVLTLALKRGAKKGNTTLRLTEARLRQGPAVTTGNQTVLTYNRPTEAQITVQ